MRLGLDRGGALRAHALRSSAARRMAGAAHPFAATNADALQVHPRGYGALRERQRHHQDAIAVGRRRERGVDRHRQLFRPRGPSVTFTAFARASMPAFSTLRASVSKTNRVAAIRPPAHLAPLATTTSRSVRPMHTH